MIQTSEQVDAIAKKLAEVMGAVVAIPRSGFNSHHRYHYVTERDLVGAISPELAKRRVAVVVASAQTARRELGGKLGTATSVTLTIRMICGDSGQWVQATAVGEGSANDDKGVYKALTGAVKYWLAKTFLVATDDDPERVEAMRREVAADRERSKAGDLKAQLAEEFSHPQELIDTMAREAWKRTSPEFPREHRMKLAIALVREELERGAEA